MKTSWLLLALLASPASAQQLEIHFLNVGQGDAAIIITPHGKAVLIDAGRTPDGVAQLLRQRRIDTLDLVVASHNHDDHIGGMPAVLWQEAVKYYLSNDIFHSTGAYRATLAAISRRHIVYLQPGTRTVTVDSVRFRELAPPATARGDQNNSSVGILVEYRGFRALFTGDSELDELQHWLQFDSIPRVDVVKVAHHGSSNGTSPEWAARTHPVVAVVSVGMNNSYNHPSPGIMRLWGTFARKVYRTDQDGEVVIDVDSTGAFTMATNRTQCRVAYAVAYVSATDARRGEPDVLCR